jgi:uncharacterized protein (TIGR02145 family)
MNNVLMKNLIVFLMVLFFVSCGVRRTAVQDPATYDVGVVINGVHWATRNVDTPSTFTRNATDAGGFFTFEEAQNACPRGWRLPTREELVSLQNAAGGEWTARNDINGRTFGTAPNQLFLPAAGFRYGDDGSLHFVGASGDYWSSTQYGSENAWSLLFDSGGVSMFYNWRALGFSVRCVSE